MKGSTNAQGEKPQLPRVTWTGTLSGSSTARSISDYFGYSTWAELAGHGYILIQEATDYESKTGKYRTTSMTVVFSDGVAGATGSYVAAFSNMSQDMRNMGESDAGPTPKQHTARIKRASNTTFYFMLRYCNVSSEGSTDWVNAGSNQVIKKIIQIF